MNFKMNRSPNDEKLFHKETENIVTLGRGSYTSTFSLPLQFGGAMHVLGGRFCSLAGDIYFSMNGNHPMKSVTTSPLDVGVVVRDIFGKVRPDLRPVPNVRKQHLQIIFGHDVWIAQNAMIMGGVKIGNGAIIGANAVVAKDIPPYAIAVGNPARVIKYRFDEETIRKFLAVKWWNWSLEKIADNLPLINDVKKFLEAHYSPALEEFPDDEFTQKLNNFAGGGQAIYQLIADFASKDPLWPKVVKGFCQSNFKNSLLVVWLDKNSTEKDFDLLSETANAFNNGASKNILAVESDENFSPAALRKATHFITTREMSTLAALDYLWNTDVKIISALDNNIFA